MPRHLWESSRLLILNKGKTSFTHDLLKAHSPIRACTREHNPHCLRTAFVSQGGEEGINWKVLTMILESRKKLKNIIFQRDVSLRRDHIDMICLQDHAILYLMDRERGDLRKKRWQEICTCWVQMLYENISHSGSCR